MKKNYANPVSRIRKVLGVTQKEFADALGVAPQHVSRAENRERLSAPFEKKIRTFIKSRNPDEQKHVLELLGRRLRWSGEVQKSEETSKAKSAWEFPEFAPVERDAWSWGLSFRNSPVLEELAENAIGAGLSCTRLRDGIILGEKRANHKSITQQHLFIQPSEFGLGPGTVVLLGSAPRHQHSFQLLDLFNRQLNIKLEIQEFPDRPGYFGYGTLLKYMTIRRNSLKRYTLNPHRYADGNSVVYKDAAAIFHGPVECFFEEGHQFRTGAKQLIWVAALQRLANGVGGRLLRDACFRREYLGECNFEDEKHVGVIVFEVTIAHNDYGNTIRKLKIIAKDVCQITHRNGWVE